jgi:hypothetical protein
MMLRAIGLLLAAVTAASAQSEGVRFAADSAFRGASMPTGWTTVITVTGQAPQKQEPSQLFNISLAPEAGNLAAKAAANQELDLAALRNRHLKTNLELTLGGKKVWVSGSFDAAQNAYVSLLVEGEPVKFFNVRGLLDKDEQMPIGTATYKISLAPNLGDQLESEIVIKNIADRKDREAVTIREMLAAVSAAGDEVKAGPQSYRCFYYDDIKNGVQDPSAQSFAFVLTDAKGEFHVFLVPSDKVPGDKLAIFKMYESRKIGLQKVGTKLRIFDNP